MSETMEARLQSEMKECMKSGDKERLGVIRMLLADIKNAKVNTAGGRDREWSDQEIMTIIANYHKNLVKTMAEYPEDRRENLRKEIAIVETFLPKQMNAEEIRSFIDAELAATPERNFGLLMRTIQPKVAGRAEGKLVSETLKAALAGK